MKIGDRVRWFNGEPEDSPEHNGKITDEDGEFQFLVRWDDGVEEWADAADLQVSE